MKTLLFVGGSRAGNEFFLSLLDHHSQILQFPGAIRGNSNLLNILTNNNPEKIAEDFIYSISDDPLVIFLMLNLVMLMIGMLMDDISGILLSASLLLPIAQNAGMDPIHFAAVLGVNLGMGNITPPTAPLLYLGAQVTNVPVRKLIWPTLIFIIFAWMPTLILTTFFPQIALWLPNMVFGP